MDTLTRTFFGNIDRCRLEAEVSNRNGEIVAILYEDSSGWHVERSVGCSDETVTTSFIEQVKAEMRSYVNRIGSDAPPEVSRGELALWLMLKDDGTAMGMPYRV
jgi:hypothetical protein